MIEHYNVLGDGILFTIFTDHQFDVISTAEYPLMQNGGTQKRKYYISMFINTDYIKDMEGLFQRVRE
jgi:hypothetical protein